MVIENFFDLQRFADAPKDTLVYDSVNTDYTWKNGNAFAGRTSSETDTANAGDSKDNPAHLRPNGRASVDGSEIYIAGAGDEERLTPTLKPTNGYTFSVEGKEWDMALKDRQNVVKFEGNAPVSLTTNDTTTSTGDTATATIVVDRGEVFYESINDAPIYIKTSDTAAGADASNPDIEVKATNGVAGATYTFGNANQDSIGLSKDATAVFTAQGKEEVYLRSTATDKTREYGRAKVTFEDYSDNAATVTSDGVKELNIAIKPTTTVTVSNDTWAFSNLLNPADDDPAKEVATIVAYNDQDTIRVENVKGFSDKATLTFANTVGAAADLDEPVRVQGRAGYGKLSSDSVGTDYPGGDLYEGKRWDSIGAANPDGDIPYLSEVIFDVEGNATIETDRVINNGGRATVVAEDGAKATFDTITADGVVANNVSIKSTDANANYVTATLEDEYDTVTNDAGVAEIATAKDSLEVVVSGDKAFKFTVDKDDEVEKKTYNIATTADNISLGAHNHSVNDSITTNNVDAKHARVILEEGEGYSVTGGDAVYEFANDIAAKETSNVTINGATVKITNSGSTPDDYFISSKDGKAGVDDVMLLKANDAVSIEGDADGFTAVFDASDFDDDKVVTFSVNGATVSVKAGNADANNVSLAVDSSGNILVTGLEEYDYYNTDNPTVITVSGGTFYFGDKKEINKVSASTAKNVSITADHVISDTNDTIPTDKVVDDYRESITAAGVNADDKKWNEISTIGSATQYGGRVDDTVNTHHGNALNDFYDLDGGNASGMAVAGYSDDQASPGSGTAIQITGDTVLGEATHVSLSVGTGDHVGEVPINIQKDESDSIVAAYIDLTTSDKPSTVAIGTQGLNSVTASHEVHLSNVGTESDPNYAYIGKYAVGENKLFGGDGVDMLRHEGLRMATIHGGAGNDTIRGDVNDIVYGGAGADYFFDTAKYAADYKVEDGDVIVATRIKSFDELTPENIHGSGNEIRIGEGQKTMKLTSLDPLDDVHIKVALLDDDGNLVRKNGNTAPDIKNIVLANGNGTVDATYAGEEGSVVFANKIRANGKGVYTILGSAGEDTIYVGNDGVVNGAGGNDSIAIDEGALNVVVSLGAGTGRDTVSGWNFGFGAQKTVLDAGGEQVIARVYEDMLHISLQGSSNSEDAILFEDTKKYESDKGHGQYDVLVGDKKYTAIRNNGDSDKGDKETSKGFASVTSNDEVADYYTAERDGVIYFDSAVTKSIGEGGWVSLGSERFYGIRELYLNNSSKASVVGTDARETVSVGGAASVGANKAVSLGGENDVIYSGGKDSLNAGHKFFFGAGDGRDTIYNYSHYQGVDEEPDKQHVDTIILQSYSGLKTAKNDTKGDRIEIGTTAEDRVVIYEEDGLSLDKTYRIQVGFDAEAKLAKIGNSEGGNNFQYSKKVAYYVGASGDAHDTLTVGDSVENAYIRLDGMTGDFYRGIDVIDASANTNTNMSLAGSADNNTIIAGGAGTTNFLWGGAGDNSLIGGEGVDYFLYYYGAEGYVQGASGNAATKGNHDVIDNFNEEQDFIFLNDVTIDQIDVAKMAANGEHAGIATDGVRVDFKNGGSLTVNVANQDHVSFYLNNGAGGYDVYMAERSTGAWKKN